MSLGKFTAARRDVNHKESFDVEYFDQEGDPHSETFWCYPQRLPGGVLFNTLRINDSSTDFWMFWQKIMDPTEYERWAEFILDEKRPIAARTIRDVMDAVTEASTGRPTEQPST